MLLRGPYRGVRGEAALGNVKDIKMLETLVFFRK